MPSWVRRYLENKPRACIASFGFLLTVAVLDYVYGSTLEFSFFYLVPLTIAAWYIGPKAAVLVALLGAIAYPLDDALAVGPYEDVWTGFWNFTVRAGTLTTIVLILNRLKTSLRLERELARTDPLTGISNARWFDELGTWECARARRADQPVSIAYLDLDGFKEINDTLGHSAGDRVLKGVAAALDDNTRAMDLVARIGGDEFVVLMPATDENAARTLIERLTSVFAELVEGAVSFSIGLATFYGPPAEIDDALRVVDALMYKAKTAGKNCFIHEVIRDLSNPAQERKTEGVSLTAR